MRSSGITAAAVSSLLVLVLFACSEERPPVGEASPPPSGSADAGTTKDATSGANPDGGPSSDDAATTDGSTSDAAPDGPAIDPLLCPAPTGALTLGSTCDSTKGWTTPNASTLSTPNANTSLDSIASDELTIVYFVQLALGGLRYYADRASTNDAFGSGVEITLEEASSRIGVSPDGLRLLLVAEDHKRLLEATRSARGQTFGAAAAGAFATINGALGAEETVQDPVISADDLTLVYSRPQAPGGNTIFFSTRAAKTDAWPVGSAVMDCELQAKPALRSPIGLSADKRTLFYLDEPRGKTRAAWRNDTNPSSPFLKFTDLAQTTVNVPNAACDRLWYSAEVDGLLHIFVSQRQ